MTIEFTKEDIDFLLEKIDKQVDQYPMYDITLSDVLYSLFNPNHVLNDWDEGKYNDPYWDDVKNQHRAYTMLEEIISSFKEFKNITV
jgi:hypothetical protein